MSPKLFDNKLLQLNKSKSKLKYREFRSDLVFLGQILIYRIDSPVVSMSAFSSKGAWMFRKSICLD